ncbi:Rrf2 family nitric oxide-sensitive transcriptional repressor [Leifsonia psychrotolerans]|uniref:Rrf2 family nitric oxide-sensitive transcriptional repressor n=1 Tax=Glaciibacter psychrotolerans TaxID=670054 RepID=A0A7Z0J6Z1_9MICO|nr:Rrf2 family nitric oxide-sensitive transcriptional repressor [Leifsonia psychrotolerans]
MKLSAFADVCLRTLMLLGSRPDQLITTREIAEQIGVPYNHVAKAVLELRNRQAIEVTRGRYGGSQISARGLQLAVGTLMRDLDVRDDVVDCVSETGVACPLIAQCTLRGALRRAREAFYAELDLLRIEDLTGPASRRLLPFPVLR